MDDAKPSKRKLILDTLLQAKQRSDQKDYVAKYNIMNKLLKERPEEFAIDQEDPNYPGIVHIPTGFRMHLPKQLTDSTISKAASTEIKPGTYRGIQTGYKVTIDTDNGSVEIPTDFGIRGRSRVSVEIAKDKEPVITKVNSTEPLPIIKMTSEVKEDNTTSKAGSFDEFVKSSVLGYKNLTGHTGPVKELLRQLKNYGIPINRVKPITTEARLPHTEHLLPGRSEVRMSPYFDDLKNKFAGVEINVLKGKPRLLMEMKPNGFGGFLTRFKNGTPGGANESPIASLFHEAGHEMHHKTMFQGGEGDRTGFHNTKIPGLDRVLDELGANNAALQLMTQAGAKPEMIAAYKGFRYPSFLTHLEKAKEEGLDLGNPIVQKVVNTGKHGYTPGHIRLADLYSGVQKSSSSEFKEKQKTYKVGEFKLFKRRHKVKGEQLTMEEGGEEIGNIQYHPIINEKGEEIPNQTWLRQLYVKDKHRNKGVGSTLLEKLIAKQKEKENTVMLRVLPFDNKPMDEYKLKDWYGARGFRNYKEEEDNYMVANEPYKMASEVKEDNTTSVVTTPGKSKLSGFITNFKNNKIATPDKRFNNIDKANSLSKLVKESLFDPTKNKKVMDAVFKGDFKVLSRMGKNGAKIKAANKIAQLKEAMPVPSPAKLMDEHLQHPDTQHFLSILQKESSSSFFLPINQLYKEATPKWAKLLAAGKIKGESLVDTLPFLKTRKIGKLPLGSGQEGIVHKGFTGGVGDTAIKTFYDEPITKKITGKGVQRTLGDPISFEERKNIYNQFPGLLPKAYGSHSRGVVLERLESIDNNILNHPAYTNKAMAKDLKALRARVKINPPGSPTTEALNNGIDKLKSQLGYRFKTRHNPLHKEYSELEKLKFDVSNSPLEDLYPHNVMRNPKTKKLVYNDFIPENKIV